LTVEQMLLASAWAWAIGMPMLPVVSMATMMSARAGKPSSDSVLLIVVEVPATSETVTGLGVSVSAADTGMAATSARNVAARNAANRMGFCFACTDRTPSGG
jgi:hypothetical protein